MKADKLIPFLVCPESREKLSAGSGLLKTASGKTYLINEKGKPDFLGKAKQEELSSKRDFLDRIKSSFKNSLGGLYVTLVHIIAPVMPRIHWGTFQTYWSYIAKKHAKGKDLVIQIGSGNDRISADIVNIDIFDFTETDIIAD